MAPEPRTLFCWDGVETRPELQRLGLDPDAFPDEALVVELGRRRGTGRNDFFPGAAMWRLVIAAATRGARAVGIEYDAEMVELSRANAAAAGVGERATFVSADLFETDLSPATVITMFLLPELNMRLRPTLLELAPGTRIVSNTWDMEDWAADATEVIDPCPGFCTALLWIVPARVQGTTAPTAGKLLATATPQAFSSAQWATIEKV